MSVNGILPIHGKALLALRNNDFSPESAIAELVDNSIQADSKNMKIRLTYEKVGSKNKPQPIEIAFGDDGEGMNKEILQKCLVLGESTRPNDRKGIGRFGVGMTNGAISLCNKIEVYSREDKGNWQHIELDLKNVNSEGSPLVTYVKEVEFPENYKDLVGNSGTLVIWSDIDRLGSSFKTEDLRYWLARTFRKYIGDQIIENKKVVDNPNKIKFTMDVIGESAKTDGSSEIHAFDPLYVIPNKNRPSDATAELIDEWDIDFEVSDIDKPDDGTKIGKIRIRMSFTPEEWRKAEGAGGLPENTARHVKDNEGISILRHHREVSFSKMFWEPSFKDLDRWWSCEIDFDPVLDHQFSVKNIKVGARPIPDLRKELQNEINGTRKSKVTKVRDVWDKNKSNLITSPQKPGGGRISDPPQPRPSKPQKPISPKERKQIEEKLKKKKLKEEEQIEILKRIEDPKSPPILLQERYIDVKSTDDYIEVEPMGNKTIAWMNMNHQFFQKVYTKIKEINELGEGSKDPQKGALIDIATNLKVDIDNIIISYIISKNTLNKLDQFDSETHENLMYHQSKALSKLYEKSDET
jgi:hypothetical protein